MREWDSGTEQQQQQQRIKQRDRWRGQTMACDYVSGYIMSVCIFVIIYCVSLEIYQNHHYDRNISLITQNRESIHLSARCHCQFVWCVCVSASIWVTICIRQNEINWTKSNEFKHTHVRFMRACMPRVNGNKSMQTNYKIYAISICVRVRSLSSIVCSSSSKKGSKAMRTIILFIAFQLAF